MSLVRAMARAARAGLDLRAQAGDGGLCRFRHAKG